MVHKVAPISVTGEYIFSFNTLPITKFEISTLITLNIKSTDNS